MFAIEFNEDNLDKIIHGTPDLTVGALETLSGLFIHRHYVFIRGYFDGRSRQPWAVMPCFVFTKTFDHDPAKIQTDWDQIVRK